MVVTWDAAYAASLRYTSPPGTPATAVVSSAIASYFSARYLSIWMSATAAAVESFPARWSAIVQRLERGDEREDGDVEHHHRDQELDQAEPMFRRNAGTQTHSGDIGSARLFLKRRRQAGRRRRASARSAFRRPCSRASSPSPCGASRSPRSMPAHRRMIPDSPSSRSRRPAGSRLVLRNSPVIATVSSTPFTEMTTLLTGPLGDEETTPGAEPGVPAGTGAADSAPDWDDRVATALSGSTCCANGVLARELPNGGRVVRRLPAAVQVRVRQSGARRGDRCCSHRRTGGRQHTRVCPGGDRRSRGRRLRRCLSSSTFIVFGTWIARIPTRRTAPPAAMIFWRFAFALRSTFFAIRVSPPQRIRTRPEPVSRVSASSSCPSCRSWSRSCRSRWWSRSASTLRAAR